MKKLQIKKLEVLSDMVVYYSQDPIARRSIENGSCLYRPTKSTSEGCAISRKCSDTRKRNFREGGIVSELIIFSNLPLFLRVLGKEFLKLLQAFHDDGSYWVSTGLSKAGFERVKDIVDLIERERV